uniref:ATP-dependent DNA helicase n=1 Tax=Salix viminalis TaxID=40686 RepID=A0A6N2MFD4_SALVM
MSVSHNQASIIRSSLSWRKIKLPRPPPTPHPFDDLLNSLLGQKSKMFRRCIRAYNSMFAFTSMGVTIDQSVNRQSGLYVFKINGHCHHLMGSLLPSNENAPKFAQLYIYDVSNEVSNRMSQFPHSTSDSCLDQTIVSDLIKMLASTNCLPDNPGYKPQLLCQRTNDSTKYSNPTSDDIGGLIVGDIGAYQSERDIIIESFSNTLQRISKLHPKFMALQYPLLFPFGEDGYRTNISFADNHSDVSGKRQRVPMRGFYAYVIQEREYGEDTLTKGGRLYQQFLVDAFANIEEDRLDYIRMNQNDLRSDLYQNISEAVLKGDVEGSSIGKIILPSSFTGGPRYMINNYQDAMAICRAYGNPDLFITFTCNTKWPEIERELDKSRAYKPEDKPDIITRVFRTKLLDMLKFIKSGAPFGKTIAGSDVFNLFLEGQWTIRSKGHSLGRIPYVHPAAGELYFLRLLLNHIKGSTSFADLRNVHGLACKAHGLLGDDKECLKLSVRQEQLHHHRNLDSFSLLKNYVLYELEKLFNASATTLQDHSLPMPNGQLLKEITNKLLREELDYDLSELRSQHSLNFASLNHGQRVIYDSIIAAIFAKKQALVFVHGHGGTGKTFLWHTIINCVRSESLIVLAVASSGIASLLLPNVWDEAPMVNKCCLEALDCSMRDVLSEGTNYNKDLPFGGKTILLGGDFRQILPVIPGGTKEQIINASLTSSILWPKFTVLTLTENMRLSTDGLSLAEKAEIRDFSKWILSVGNGQISDLTSLGEADESFVTIPFHLLLQASCDPIPTIIDPGYYKERAIVTTKNTTVAEINDFVLRITPGTKRVYLSVDSVSTSSTETDDASSLYPIEYINQLEFNGVPSHELALKVGTPVMLLRNISPSIGLCNGTRLIITQLSSKGNAIQASAKGKNIEPFVASIIEGDYYQVYGFYTFENRYTNSVVSHEAIIDLKSDTKVAKIDPMTPPIPRHYFNFIDFAHLFTTGRQSGVLTDVLGRLKGVQPLEQIMVRGQDLTDTREFIIENIMGEELRVILWGYVAKRFNDADLANQSSPLIIVFAAFQIIEFKGKPNLASTVASLWYFNPEIKELLPYKHYYKDIPVEVHQLPSTTTAQTIDQQLKENRRTIKEILCMDPYQYKSQRFTCKASIADYDLHRGWWYNSCPLCTKSVSDKGTGFKCIEHNEVTPIPWFRVDCIVTDSTDVTTFLMVGKTAENFFGSSAHSYVYDKGFIDSIPTPMIDKLQKPKIFQLRFGTFRSMMNRCDIIVANVFDDITEVESQQQHVEPELHDSNVPLMEQASASSSSKDPVTPTPIPPFRADITTPSPSHAKKHLLLATTTKAEPQDVIPLVDPSASTMPKEDDQAKKHHCPSKSLDD